MAVALTSAPPFDVAWCAPPGRLAARRRGKDRRGRGAGTYLQPVGISAQGSRWIGSADRCACAPPAYNVRTTARPFAGPRTVENHWRPMVDDPNNVTETRSVLSRSYLASLPERTARAGAALTGGLAYEAGEVMLPLAVRRSRFYQEVIGRLLRITIELVGGVEDVYPEEEIGARDLLIRKTAGNVVELGSFVAVGWSPVWLLAGASDLIGGSRAYLRVL